MIDDEATVLRICEILDGLPLAIRLVGRYLHEVEETPADYLTWLEAAPFEALSQGEHQESNVGLLIERSLDQVGAQAKLVLSLAGLLALAPFGIEGIEIAAKLFRNEMRRAVNKLISFGLLLRDGDRLKISHALIHTYAEASKLDNDLFSQFVSCYIDIVVNLTARGVAGFHLLDKERVHLLQLARHCVKRKEWTLTLRLVIASDNYLDLQGYWLERFAMLGLGQTANSHLGDSKNTPVFFALLGDCFLNLGNWETAKTLFDITLPLTQLYGDQPTECAILANLGRIYSNQGEINHAIEFYEKALAIAEEIGDGSLKYSTIGNLGVSYQNLGEQEKAKNCFEQALTYTQKTKNRRYEGHWWGHLAITYKQVNLEKATSYTKKALEIAQETGDKKYEGIWAGNLGHSQHDQGNLEQAISYYNQALKIAKEIGDKSSEGHWLYYLAKVYHSLEEFVKAKDYCEQATDIFGEINSPNMTSAIDLTQKIDTALS